MPFAYFPTPMHDELLYSTLARYREALHIPDSCALKERCIGQSQKIVATNLPLPYQFIREVYGEEVDAEEFFLRHTPYPYLACFESAKGRRRLRLSYGELTKRSAGSRGMRHGLVGTSPHKFLLFCPACVERDVKATGQAAWRRVHQLPGVVVCPWHREMLRISRTPTSVLTLQTCPCDPDEGQPLDIELPGEMAYRVAALSLEMLETHRPPLEHSVLAKRIRALAGMEGWEHHTRDTLMTDFAEHVIQSFGPDRRFWGKRDYRQLALRIASTWHNTEMAPTSVAPIYYVAVLASLGRTIQDLFTSPGPDKEASDETIGAAANRRRARWSSKAIAGHKDKYLAFRQANPAATRKEIWHSMVNTRNFLHNHDPGWLERMSPPKVGSRDRGEYDTTIADQVPAIATSLQAVAGPPVRVTQIVIIAELQKVHPLKKNLYGLPLTALALRTSAESVDQFMKRRLLWAIGKHVASGASWNISALRRKSRFPPSWTTAVKSLVAAIHGAAR